MRLRSWQDLQDYQDFLSDLAVWAMFPPCFARRQVGLKIFEK
jgi:hypothetical protein